MESNFVSIDRLFVLVYSTQDSNSKRFKTPRYYLPKWIIDNYIIIINRKNLYDLAIDSDIKRYEEFRKLTTGQGEDSTTECLLDFDYIGNHYRLIVVVLSRQKELDTDPKAIQQKEFVGQSNQIVATKSMLVLTVLEKIKSYQYYK